MNCRLLSILPLLLLWLGTALPAQALVRIIANEDSIAQRDEDPDPTPPIDPGPGKVWSDREFQDIIKRLADERFVLRESASEELAKAAPEMIESIRRVALSTKDLEVRERLTAIMRQVFEWRVLPLLPEGRKGRGFLGISWGLNGQPAGVKVNGVLNGHAAERAGVLTNDVIVAINGTEFGEGLTRESAMEFFQAMAPGDLLRAKIIREGEARPIELAITVGEKPNEHLDPTIIQQQRDRMCEQFVAGELKLPERVLRAGSSAVRQAYLPLQTWPRELESRK